MKKIIAVGGGIAGITAAIRLQHLGYQVHLYEKNATVGGKMNQISKAGFSFDVGPTIVMMKEVYEELFTFCGKDPKDYFTMEKVEPMLDLYFPKEEALSFSSELPEMIKMLESVCQEDTQGYMAFLSDIYQRYLVAQRSFLSRSYRHFWDFYNPKMLVEGLKLKTFNDAYSSISKFVKDERLRKSLAFQTLYIGVSPYQGPSLYTMIPMIELFYGIYFIKGGMFAFAQSLQQLFLDLGGKLHLNTEVKEIIFEDKRAVGIRTSACQINGDAVICGADFPYAMANLIPDEKKRGKYTNKKIDSLEYSCSCFLMYLGVDKKYPVKALHSIYFAEDFKKNVDQLFETGELPDDPSFYIYVPTLLDESLAPKDHEAIYVLVPVPELSKYKDWSEEAVSQYRRKVLEKIKRETIFKDIEEHIVFEEHFTPEKFEKTFNAYNGATFGLKPTLKQSNYYRPHNKFDYGEGLYFCGSSTHPGAGVPIVMQSAKLAVEELLKDDGRI